MTRTLVQPASATQDDLRFYLLVLEGGASSFFHLSRTGVILIGRAPECDLRLTDGSISRRHARITVAQGEATLEDLESHNGTRVAGIPVSGGRVLSSGDVITLGEVTLVFHCGRRSPAQRLFFDMGLLQHRLAEEVERALSYQRPLSVLLVQFPAALAAAPKDAAQTAVSRGLRLIDVAGWVSPTQLAVLLPELPGLQSRVTSDLVGTLQEALEAVLGAAGTLRCGLATCPEDACDADTLLSAATAAAAAAAAGETLEAAQTSQRLNLAGRQVLLADPAMVRLYEMIRRLARSDLPVLVTGETGAGKENAAFAVHHYSPRSQGPFVALNCAALAETLLESELFGHERGAFSGATQSKTGLLESASGGTVFLDEVGELSLGAQSKLLRALEQKRITRVGDLREREINVRVVAATNRDLEAEVAAKRFRQDLFFRLSAAAVVLPPLRERPREIALLAEAFLEQACARLQRAPLTLSPATLRQLARYRWPGNVRELRNTMEYLAAAVQEPWPVAEPWHLPERVSGLRAPPKEVTPEAPAVPADEAAPTSFRPLAEELRELELRRIKEALRAAGDVRKRAAELIGMPLRTFVLRLKQYGINQEDG